jgi:prepilin-type N-terminal cleavage/methylation domain-containing protein
MKRLRRSQRGFTLIELVIYLGIVGLVLVSATLFAYEFVASQSKAAAYEEVNRNARYAIARIGLEIREASDLNVGASTLGSSPSTLSLASASGPINPTVFTVSSGALNIQQGAGAVTPVTNAQVEVTEFLVEDLSVSGKTKILRVRLGVKAKNPSDLVDVRAETVVETTAKIRKNDGFAN